jgi:general secretion pathway protein H
MRTWAIGKPGSVQRGFTLLELLLVVAITAVVAAGATLALRDSSQSQLDREAQRLAAVLEAARAQARASGAVVRWHLEATGFAFDGLGGKVSKDLPNQWQDPGTRAELRNGTLLLGPDPVLPAQSVRLWQADRSERSLWVASDGLRPFAVVTQAP